MPARGQTTGAGRGLRQWARNLRAQAYALDLARRDPRVPRLAKILIVLAVAYALSPLDLIPDFIPVLGYLDDLLLLPLLIWVALRLVPEPVWRDCRAAAQRTTVRSLPATRRAVWLIASLWALALAAAGMLLWHALRA